MDFRKCVLLISCSIILSCILISDLSHAQPPLQFVYSKSEMLKYTGQYKGERFSNGRPKVSNDILERMKLVTVEEAWGVLRQHGYVNQYEGNWIMTHDNPVLVGRAVTCSFIPLRPDIRDITHSEGKKQGYEGRDKHWIMDSLVKSDVIVVDLYI